MSPTYTEIALDALESAGATPAEIEQVARDLLSGDVILALSDAEYEMVVECLAHLTSVANDVLHDAPDDPTIEEYNALSALLGNLWTQASK